MTAKQRWLLDRLLIPAGILPPAIKFADLAINEHLRRRIGNLGFEYFHTVVQDPEKVNTSSVGGKIFALHCPWPLMPKFEMAIFPVRIISNALMFNQNLRPPRDFTLMMERSLEFAQRLGAKIVTTHATFFDQDNLIGNLASLARLEEKYGVKVAIESEGTYMNYEGRNYLRRHYRRFDGMFEWLINPVAMIKTLDKIYPQKKFPITLDSASLICSRLPVVATVKKVYPRIAHFHLASNPPGGDDLALEISDPENINLVNFLYEKKYSGYITAEIGPTVGSAEELLGTIYAASSLLGINLFKKQVTENAARHIENSCRFLLNNLS